MKSLYTLKLCLNSDNQIYQVHLNSSLTATIPFQIRGLGILNYGSHKLSILLRKNKESFSKFFISQESKHNGEMNSMNSLTTFKIGFFEFSKIQIEQIAREQDAGRKSNNFFTIHKSIYPAKERIERFSETYVIKILGFHPASIHYIYAIDDYLFIYHGNQYIRLKHDINDFLREVAYPFFIKINPSTIVNLSYLYAFNSNELILKNEYGCYTIPYYSANNTESGNNFYFKRPDFYFSNKVKEFGESELEFLERAEKNALVLIDQKTFSINLIAMKFGLGVRQFQRNFLQLTGIGPKQFFKEILLQKAHDLVLNNGNKTMVEIAHEIGYHDAYYFKKIYNNRFETSN